MADLFSRLPLDSLMRLCLMLVAAPLLSALFPQEAKANIVCLVGSAGLDMGNSSSGTGTITWTCTKYVNPRRTFTLCVALGFPSWPGTAAQPVLRHTGSNTFLNYNVYRNASLSTIWTASQPLSQSITITGRLGSSVSGSFTFYAGRDAGSTAGNYNAFFYNSILGFLDNNGNCQTFGSVGGTPLSAQQFTLPVTAAVSNSCNVSALGNANLGTVAATAGPVFGSTAISVTCPNGTPYAISLAPSNGNSAGAGVLSGTGSNTDQPAYQLHRNSNTGPIWGNTASTSGAGNGASGTGNGSAQNFPVYVTVPDADYTPDNYSDTVTVTVHF
ncbi:spore coat U domain-containing protein [Altererythrobacter sp. KTW20L]|nr:spore coat U domain-containing protein [Altererythrobacter sp. KTW20L]